MNTISKLYNKCRPVIELYNNSSGVIKSFRSNGSKISFIESGFCFSFAMKDASSLNFSVAVDQNRYWDLTSVVEPTFVSLCYDNGYLMHIGEAGAKFKYPRSEEEYFQASLVSEVESFSLYNELFDSCADFENLMNSTHRLDREVYMSISDSSMSTYESNWDSIDKIIAYFLYKMNNPERNSYFDSIE